MRSFLFPVALLALPLLGGCLAKTAANIVTLPVRAAGQTADWVTTSQDEADRNAGRKARKAEEKRAREDRKARRQEEKARRESEGRD